jgi:leucyl aminopeptidase
VPQTPAPTEATLPLVEPTAAAVPLVPIPKPAWEGWIAEQSSRRRAWAQAQGFKAEPGTTCMVPGEDGRAECVLFGTEAEIDVFAFGGLAMSLPAGTYRLDALYDARAATDAAVGWALGAYRFRRYRKRSADGGRKPAELVWPDAADRAEAARTVGAVAMVRDLINTPANDMGPAELAAAAEALAKAHKAKCRVIVGDDLLEAGYPAVHAVGRASARAPRLIDITWGKKSAPRVTLVGKGVCFDTGGLDLKPSSGMLLMKKDMGGAAHVLGLARMIMEARLPVRLRVLVPAVENAVSGDSFRPLDVIGTRKGLTVEIGNTDAEGRLILCDALHEACTEKPALLIDFATLTGAARVALGPDLPAMFANDDRLADDLLAAGRAVADPVWRLPLHQPYRRHLDGKVADLNNVASGGFAGAIYAALFLEAFVDEGVPWAHFDVMAWNPSSRPGRPEGGEALAMRAAYRVIADRFGGAAGGAS